MELTITFHISEELVQKLNDLGVSQIAQEEALSDAIFLHIQERFLEEEEDALIEHAVDWES